MTRPDIADVDPSAVRWARWGGVDRVRAGYAAVTIAVFLWGVGGLFVRGISMSALPTVLYRNWLSVPIALVIAWRCRAPLTWRTLALTAPAGVAFVAAQVFGFSAFKETSVANAALIGSLAPVVVVLAAALLFGEQWRHVQLLFAALALGGAVIVVLGSASNDGAARVGDLYAVGALLSQAAYFLLIKRLRLGGLHPSTFLAGLFVVAAVTATPLAVLSGDDLGMPSAHDWLLMVGLVLFSGYAGHGLIVWAQKHIRLGVTSVMTLGSSVVTTIGGWAIFHQHLAIAQLLGGALLLASVAMLLRVQGAHPSAAASLTIPTVVE